MKKQKLAKYAMVLALSSSIIFSNGKMVRAEENLNVNSINMDSKEEIENKIELIKKEIAQLEKQLNEKLKEKEE